MGFIDWAQGLPAFRDGLGGRLVLCKPGFITFTNLSACRFDWGWYGWERICSIFGFCNPILLTGKWIVSVFDRNRLRQAMSSEYVVESTDNNFWPFNVQVNQPPMGL